MKDKLEDLRRLLGEIFDLERARDLLEWDQSTYMPPGAAPERALQLATLSKLSHQKLISGELSSLLEDARQVTASMNPDSDDARLVQRLTRKLEKLRKVPAEWVEEKARAVSLSKQAWEKARKEDDFPHFEPHLTKMVGLIRQYTEFFPSSDHYYDPLLDDYESGMQTNHIRTVFAELLPEQVNLIREIGEREPIDASLLYQPFAERKQWDFGLEVIRKIGFDFQRGRQDISAHPYTTHFGIGDVRITTRIHPNYFGSGFFATLHEVGHALYEQGIRPDLGRTLLAEGASLGIHESQSRLWENLVGRSRAFWTWAYPRLQQIFPQQFGDLKLETFYRAINKVEPSPIRVEADEATYNLHIMLRFELELTLLDGSLQVADLPEAWNGKMQEYLGVTPPDDATGVLQDIHWSEGLIGYFPTYALGNLFACQLWQLIKADIPALEAQIERGEFGALRGWLDENLYQHGAKFLPMELVERVTGGGLSAEPYLAYLRSKFGQIYGLV